MNPAATSANAAVPALEAWGDFGLLLRWPAQIDLATHAAVQQCADQLRASPPCGLQTLLPAYASLGLRFTREHCLQDPDWRSTAMQAVRAAMQTSTSAPLHARPTILVPVCYGADCGADFAALCARLGLSADALIALHSAPRYRVAMLGFAPGFPYLIGMDPRLACPRHAQPRVQVPAGSVGIAGQQSGIYPRASPGGWQLIGRTPWRLFDPQRDPPARFAAGDWLQFQPISWARFCQLDQHGPAP